MLPNTKAITKKPVAKIALVRVKKLPAPAEPNIVPDAPPPNDAPAFAPLPC